MWIVLAILALGVIIIVHEGGHYLVAKWCRMKVDRFSLGFGPAIATWKRKGTEFTLAPIPFGGFVAIRGMNIAEDVDPDDPYVYPNRPLWQRMAAIFAGPAANYLFAVVLALFYFGVYGAPTGTAWWGVGDVTEDGASVGILQAGDRILEINEKPLYASYEGKTTSLLETIQDEMRDSGPPVSLLLLRDGQRVSVEITPKLGKVKYRDENENVTEVDRYLLGIRPSVQEERMPVGAVGTVKSAAVYPVVVTERFLVGLYLWARGRVEAEWRAPPGIIQDMAEKFSLGWKDALEYLVLFNVWLGLLNLLPLPALDGGRLIFLGYEMTTRRRPNPKIEATVHMVGLMFFLLLIVVISGKDIIGMLAG